jgi:hypothetical protein
MDNRRRAAAGVQREMEQIGGRAEGAGPNERNRAMTEKPAPVTPVVTENIPSLAGGVSAIASANAPFIYFDGVPNFGFNFGVANISLEALRFTAVPGTTNVVTDRVTVAHLRMSTEGLRQLKSAIEGIELLAKPTADGKKN